MIVYHLTTKKNFNKIQSEGLKPKIGPRSKELGEDNKVVYFFRSEIEAEDALCNWYGECFGEDEEFILMEVNIQGFNFNDNPSTFEVTVSEMIPSDRIISFRNI